MSLKNYLRHQYHAVRKVVFPPIRSGAKAELQSYKDLHKGKKAIIIGNGPSVRLEDFGKFKDFITFGCNRFHLCYKDTDFKPTYTVCIDPKMISDFGHDIAASCNNDLFISSLNVAKTHVNAKYIYRHRKIPFYFSNDITEFVSNGSSVVVAAIQIAYYMGVKEIYVYGIDHLFKYNSSNNYPKYAIGDKNHFIDNYRDSKNWCPPRIDEIEESFAYCYEWLKQNGVKLINISHKTKLDVIPKKKLAEIIK